MKDKKKIVETGLLFLIIIVGIYMVLNFVGLNFDYERYHNEGITYEKAIVTAILKEELEIYEADDEHMIGHQLLRVKLLGGSEKGKEYELENNISITHNVILRKGDRVVICADRPGGVEPYYSVYNYDRSIGMWVIVAGFLFLAILVGRKQGVKSCLGLIFTMIMIVCYLLPALYTGKSAVSSAVITVCVSSFVTCFCIGGLRKKTIYNMVSSSFGGISAGIIYCFLADMLSIGGNCLAEVESLVLISQSTGMHLNGLMFAGIMIAALGAVMDVAVSLGAALNEIQIINPNICRKELFQSGINIGRDMIGTMTNTLILSFLGGVLSTLVIFISYGIQYNQLLSSDFLAVEVVQGIAGSSAVILTVPITAAVCALGYGKRK